MKMGGYFLFKVTNTQYEREIAPRRQPLCTDLSTSSVDKETPAPEVEILGFEPHVGLPRGSLRKPAFAAIVPRPLPGAALKCFNRGLTSTASVP